MPYPELPDDIADILDRPEDFPELSAEEYHRLKAFLTGTRLRMSLSEIQAARRAGVESECDLATARRERLRAILEFNKHRHEPNPLDRIIALAERVLPGLAKSRMGEGAPAARNADLPKAKGGGTTAEDLVPVLRDTMRRGVFFSTPKEIAENTGIKPTPHHNTVVKALLSEDDLSAWADTWLKKNRKLDKQDEWLNSAEFHKAFGLASGQEQKRLCDNSIPLKERRRLATEILARRPNHD